MEQIKNNGLYKILAIAYACEPDRGSEPGVGWNWAKSISETPNIDITVITRANNRPVIERYVEKNPELKIRFLYYDLPKWILKYKKGDRAIKLFFTLWQRGVIRYIKEQVDLSYYDFVWDFNFGSLNLPLFTYKLHKKYVVGPVSTKKKVPKPYIQKMSIKSRVKYNIQQFMKEHLWSNPIVWKALKHADNIILCNELSREFIPKKQRKKAQVVFHNGIVKEDYPIYNENRAKKNKLEFVYAGRLIESKNLDTAIKALKLVKDRGKDFSFDIYGNGNCKKQLQKLVSQFGMEKEIIFHNRIKQSELFEEYIKKDCFLFPSLLEISSTAVMEAMFCGLLPICLNIRCMEFIFEQSPVVLVPCHSPQKDVENLAEEIMKLQPAELQELKKQCYEFAKERFLWSTRREDISSLLSRLV